MLTSHAKSGDPLELQAIHGLGEMMRLDAAKHVAQILGSTKDAQVAEAAAIALGTLGSSWAWKSLGPKAQATGLEVRKVCANALAPRAVRGKTALRTAASEALLMVDHPETLDLLRAQRSVSGTDARVVDGLVARVERKRQRAPK